MDGEALVEVMILLAAANGAPVLLKRLLGQRGGWPLDGGRRFADGRPLLGPSKTWRGLLGGVAAAALSGALLGWTVAAAALFGFLSLLGDLLSSFAKRRLGIAPSGQALLLDQLPEALLPTALFAPRLGLGVLEVLLVGALFLAGELALSRLLYAWGIRDRPY